MYDLLDALVYDTAELAPRVPSLQLPANGDKAIVEPSYTVAELFSDYNCTQRVGNISFRNIVFERGTGDYDTMTFEAGFVSIKQNSSSPVYSYYYTSLLAGSQRVFTSNSYNFAVATILEDNSALFVAGSNTPLEGKYNVTIDANKIRTISLTTDSSSFPLNGQQFYYSLPYVTDNALVMTINSRNIPTNLGYNAASSV